MKKLYPIHVFDMRFQLHHVNPEKNSLFENIRGSLLNASVIARLFAIVTKHSEFKVFAEGKKGHLNFFKRTLLRLKVFLKRIDLKCVNMKMIKKNCNFSFYPRDFYKNN